MIRLSTVKQALEGKTVKDAEITALWNQWTLRTMRENGEDLAGTADYVENRINISVNRGIVDQVLSVG